MAVTALGLKAFDSLSSHARDSLRAVCRDIFSFIDPAHVNRLRKTLGLDPLLAFIDKDGRVTWSYGDRVLEAAAGVQGQAEKRLVVFHLDGASVLRRTINLPAVAARQLGNVLRLNIGSWTPFSADEVFTAATVLGPGPGRNLVAVEVRCALKALVQQRASDTLVQPDSIWLGDRDFEAKIDTLKRRRFTRLKATVGVLAGAAFLQSVILVEIVLARQDDAISSLESRRAALTRIARQRADATKMLEVQQAERSELSHKMSEAESLTSRLRVLASALPKGTTVREFIFSRERGGGNIVLLAPQEFDATTALQATEQFQVRNLTISGELESGGRTYAIEFAVLPQHREPSL